MSGGRWALVTGASKGIGAASARALAADGWNLVVHCGTDVEGAHAVAEDCRIAGVQARIVPAALPDGVGELLAAVEDIAPLGALVSNAGGAVDGLALTMSDEAFRSPWQVHVDAAFRLTRGVLRGMVRAREGRIVYVGSVVGLHGNPGQANYAAAKAGLVGMAKSLAREVGGRGITVNVVAPGFVGTAMTADLQLEELVGRVPAGRIGTPQEVAAAVTFLCSPSAAYVNGAVLQVDGGLFA